MGMRPPENPEERDLKSQRSRSRKGERHSEKTEAASSHGGVQTGGKGRQLGIRHLVCSQLSGFPGCRTLNARRKQTRIVGQSGSGVAILTSIVDRQPGCVTSLRLSEP